jgi:hypothetical protein
MEEKRYNVDDVIRDVNIDMGLTLGTIKNVNVFPKELGDKMLSFTESLTKIKEDALTADKAISVLKEADAILTDIEACLDDIKDGEIKQTEKEKTEAVPYVISYALKRYVLIPLLTDETKRKDLTARLDEIPDENAFKPILTKIKEDDTFTIFDGFNMIGNDLLKAGYMTEGGLNKIMEDIAYEESKELEKAHGTKDEEMPTERQKKYVNLRMGYHKETVNE